MCRFGRKSQAHHELAQKSRHVGLTEEEKAEQQRLRQEYVKAFRAGLDGMLDGVFVAGQNGEAVPIKAYMKEKYGTKESK